MIRPWPDRPHRFLRQCKSTIINIVIFTRQARLKQNWIGPAEYMTACVSTQQLGVSFGGNFSILMFRDRFWGHFFSLIFSSWQAGFWFDSARLYASNIWLPTDSYIYTIPDPGSTKIRAAAQATNAAAGAEPCYSRSRGKRRTLQLGPNYATLVWHRRHLACGRQIRIFPACTSMWPLKKPWKVPKIGPAMAWAPDRLCRPC